jgi:undecaprenyl diphosphate synthase
MQRIEIDPKHLPRHIAIIMDGNSRWAQQHGLSREAGHEAGATSVRVVIEACRELGGIEVLTLYAFSTENWRRSKTEVDALFRLLSKYISLELENIHKQDIRVTFMGRMEGLSGQVVQDIRRCMNRTAGNKSMTVNVAINYGGRAEIADAAKAIAAEVAGGHLRVEDVDEGCMGRHLYVPELVELDLLIRTSGEMRLSNFMLWQVSYAEIVMVRTPWPDFRKRHLYRAIAEYQSRQRRLGGR